MSRPFIWSAFLALLAGGCAIAFAGIFVRLADVGPMASAFWRMALAAPVLWCLAARDSVAMPTKLVPWQGIVAAGVCFAGDLILWHWALTYTTVANATLESNFAPIFVALGLWFLYRQLPSKLFLVALFTALGGAILMIGPHINLGGMRLVGDGLGFASAIFYAAYQLAVKSVRKTVSTARLMAWSTTISALVLLPISVFAPQPFWPHSAAGWATVFALAFVSQIGGQGAIAFAFAHLAATFSSVSLLIQPVMAAIFAWLIFGEALTMWQLFGGALVILGIALAARSSQRYG